jgi:hypothetical protein
LEKTGFQLLVTNMLKSNIFVIFLLLALTVSACSAATQPAPTLTVEPAPTVTVEPAPTVIVEPTSQPVNFPQTEADVPRVTAEEAKAAFDSGAAIIVDVRITEAFTARRIQGALSIPLAGIETDPASVTLDKNQWIITYCT